MATQVQLRRGTTTQNNAFTGANGELSVDTDVKTIRIHDGLTAGGGSTLVNTTVAQTLLNKTFSTGSVWNGSPVPVGYGGTGAALTPVAGAVPYSTGSAMALSAAGTSGQVLVSGGTGSPVWVNASSVTAGSALTATSASNIAGGSAGQLLIQSDTDLTTFITAGEAGTFLQSAGAGYAPTWAAGQVTIGSTAIALGNTSASLDGLDILTATGHSHWKLPVGDNSQRPGSPAAGMVRYNTDTVSFEGYSSGAWSSLGGVSSVDKYTYIRAETSAGASNGELEFFAKNTAGNGATKAMGITKDGVTIAGNLTVQGTTVTNESTIITYADPLLELNYTNGGTLTSDNGKDIGLRMHYYKGSDKNAALVLANDTSMMEFYADGTETNGVFSGTYGYFRGKGFNYSGSSGLLEESFSATTSGTSPTSFYSFASGTYRSAELTVQVTHGTNYRLLKMLLIHDGTNVTISENYGVGTEIQTGDTATTFTASISGGTLTVYATAASGTSVLKGKVTLIKV
jgi:hypothetical protein